MATTQIGVGVQNDGNFSFLEQFDSLTGIANRVETFRCSQPVGTYGITEAGSRVSAICGKDHLTSISNHIHRFIYSRGQTSKHLPILLEGREQMNPEGLPNGSWDSRVRDLDF